MGTQTRFEPTRLPACPPSCRAGTRRHALACPGRKTPLLLGWDRDTGAELRYLVYRPIYRIYHLCTGKVSRYIRYTVYMEYNYTGNVPVYRYLVPGTGTVSMGRLEAAAHRQMDRSLRRPPATAQVVPRASQCSAYLSGCHSYARARRRHRVFKRACVRGYTAYVEQNPSCNCPYDSPFDTAYPLDSGTAIQCVSLP